MNKGDVVVCRNASGYVFTEGKTYGVIAYHPEWFDSSVPGGFTWPAYVVVRDDYGRNVRAHAHRFTPKED